MAVQSLSDSTKYKDRYLTLRRLGINDKSLFKTTRKQLLILFCVDVYKRQYQGYADTDRLCGVFHKGKDKVQRVRLQAWHGAGTAVQTVGTIGKAGTA